MGYVRAFDVRTGKRLWIFHTIPLKGEFGHETWNPDAAANTGNTGVWAQMSADEELGYAYLPLTSATNDVDFIAGSTANAVSFTDADGLTVGTVNSVGLTAGGDTKLTATGILAFNQALKAAGFKVELLYSVPRVPQHNAWIERGFGALDLLRQGQRHARGHDTVEFPGEHQRRHAQIGRGQRRAVGHGAQAPRTAGGIESV